MLEGGGGGEEERKREREVISRVGGAGTEGGMGVSGYAYGYIVGGSLTNDSRNK